MAMQSFYSNNSSNTTYSNSSTASYTVFTASEDIVIKVLYILLSLIGIIGNSAVILIISKDKRIQNTVNLLIVNLSLSDIAAGLAVYPYLFIDISPEDKHAHILCGIKNGLTLFNAAAIVNFMTLGVLSLSRYILINHPTKVKWRIRKNHVKWISVATWLIGISFLIPNIFAFRYFPASRLCRGYWPEWLNKPAFFSITVIVFMIPLLSLLFTFVSTVYTLWFKGSTRRLTRSNSVSGVQSSRKKVTILLGLLILAFLICWLPFSVFWLLATVTTYFSDSDKDTIKKLRIMRFCVLIAFSNACFDPVIYALGNRQIKEGARKTLRKGHANNVEPTNTGYE